MAKSRWSVFPTPPILSHLCAVSLWVWLISCHPMELSLGISVSVFLYTKHTLKKNGVLLFSWTFFMRKNRRQAGTGHEAGFTLRSVSTITILIIKSKCQEKRIIDWHVHAFQSWVLCSPIHFQPVMPSVHLRQLQGLSALLLDGKQSFSPQDLKKGARSGCSSPKLDYVPKLYS